MYDMTPIRKLREIALSKGRKKSTEDVPFKEFRHEGITVEYFFPMQFADGDAYVESPEKLRVYKRRYLFRKLILETSGMRIVYSKNNWRQDVQEILASTDE